MKVSIITAVRNARDTIERTIESVLRQSYSGIEYIIVDGVSTDGTLEVIAEHRASLSALVVERDKGVYEAFKGAATCQRRRHRLSGAARGSSAPASSAAVDATSHESRGG